MAGNSFGTLFRVTTFGESHGTAIGCIVDGCPSGLALAEADIQHELDRRRPGQNRHTTSRNEPDRIQILSGIFEGKTTGAPIGLLIMNTDSRSEDYETIKDAFRPGHGDFTFANKFGHRDWRGGGRQSSRETAMRVAAGAIAKKLLSHSGITVTGMVIQIGSVKLGDAPRDLSFIEQSPVRCPNKAISGKMEAEIDATREAQDSVGGIVEVIIRGVPVGLGEPVFDKLDADLAKAVLSIGATKGIEFGAGFAAAALRGSAHNDPMRSRDGKVIFESNNAGGILGGISNGDDIILRTIVKPIASIGVTQQTVTTDNQNTEITVRGRHDPCYCIRAVPVIESMVALVLADHLLRSRTSRI